MVYLKIVLTVEGNSDCRPTMNVSVNCSKLSLSGACVGVFALRVTWTNRGEKEEEEEREGGEEERKREREGGRRGETE